MIKQIKCPHHEGDNTPSMTLYPDGSSYCFGCGHYSRSNTYETYEEKRHVENMEEKIKYITSLEIKPIRGLSFPCDNNFYYIVWPDHSYYKGRRLLDEDKGSKYKCPAGHVQPALWVAQTGALTLLVVEGEINALSISPGPYDIVSPGGSTQLEKFSVPNYYKHVIIICDEDKAGASSAIKLASKLHQNTALRVTISLWNEDANSILVKYGKGELYAKIQNLVM